jgi:hypothetical protein
MNNVKQLFHRFILGKLIHKTVRLMFSQKITLSEDEDVNSILISKVARRATQIDLLRVYFAVLCVTKHISYNKPYVSCSNEDIEWILDELEKVEKFKNKEVTDLSLELYRLRALDSLRLASYYFKRGFEAFMKDQYSFEGMRFDMEKIKSRPLTRIEFDRYKNWCAEYSEFKTRLTVVQMEYEEHILNLTAQQNLDNIIEEVEMNKKLHGLKSKDQIDQERGEILASIRRKLEQHKDKEK